MDRVTVTAIVCLMILPDAIIGRSLDVQCKIVKWEFDGRCPVNEIDRHCASDVLKCSPPLMYHCARDINKKGEEWTEACAKSVVCEKGKEPWLNYLNNQMPTDTPTVICKACSPIDAETATYNRRARNSSDFSRCTRVTGCKGDLVINDCGTLTDRNGYCRCNASGGFRPWRSSVTNECSEDLRCTHNPCPEGHEYLINYTCVSKCQPGYYRPDRSDVCTKLPETTTTTTTKSSNTSTTTRGTTTSSTTKTSTEKPNTSSQGSKEPSPTPPSTVSNKDSGSNNALVISISVAVSVAISVGILISKRKLCGRSSDNHDPNSEDENNIEMEPMLGNPDTSHVKIIYADTYIENKGEMNLNMGTDPKDDTRNKSATNGDTQGEKVNQLQNAPAPNQQAEDQFEVDNRLVEEYARKEMDATDEELEEKAQSVLRKSKNENDRKGYLLDLFAKGELDDLKVTIPTEIKEENIPGDYISSTGASFKIGKSSGEHQSCLYQSVSQLLFGSQNKHCRLRLRSAIHALKNEEQYCKKLKATFEEKDGSDEDKKADLLAYFDSMGIDVSDKDKKSIGELIDDGIRQIVLQTLDYNRDSCRMHVQFLSEALGCSIQEECPKDMPYYKEWITKTDSASQQKDDLLQLNILWERTEGATIPNHISPLIPCARTT